ncbi:MAG: PQQ-binding-like beta-propeller repeat protein [Candidatus Xenobiia bacterium LiM19]
MIEVISKNPVTTQISGAKLDKAGKPSRSEDTSGSENDAFIRSLTGEDNKTFKEISSSLRNLSTIGRSPDTVNINDAQRILDGDNELKAEKAWEFETGGRIGSSAAIDDKGTIYFGSEDRKLYAVKAKSQIQEALEKNETEQERDTPSIVEEDEWIIIGGIKLDKKSYNLMNLSPSQIFRSQSGRL